MLACFIHAFSQRHKPVAADQKEMVWTEDLQDFPDDFGSSIRLLVRGNWQAEPFALTQDLVVVPMEDRTDFRPRLVNCRMHHALA